MTLLVMQTVARAQGSTDSLLRDLTMAIEKAPAYDAAKEQRIAGLRTALQQDRMASPGTLFPIYERLYYEYQIFNYDSAYEYAGKLQQIAYRLGDPATNYGGPPSALFHPPVLRSVPGDLRLAPRDGDAWATGFAEGHLLYIDGQVLL